MKTTTLRKWILTLAMLGTLLCASTLRAQSITVTSPEQNAILNDGGAGPILINVVWTSSGLTNNKVTIAMYDTQGHTAYIAAKRTVNQGSFYCPKVPLLHNGIYYFQVSGGGAVGNSGYFEVINSPAGNVADTNMLAAP